MKKHQRGAVPALRANLRRFFGEGTLAAELDGHLHLDGNGLAIEHRRLIFPSAKRIESGLTQHGWARGNVHLDDFSVLVDGRLNHDVALDTGLHRADRINRSGG